MRTVELRRGTYVDSVTLMQVSRRVAALDGVTSALVAMATDLNLELAAGMGFDVPAASPNELLVAVEARRSTPRSRSWRPRWPRPHAPRRPASAVLRRPSPSGPRRRGPTRRWP